MVWPLDCKRSSQYGGGAVLFRTTVPVPERTPPEKVIVELLFVLLLTVMVPLSMRFPVILRLEAPMMSKVPLLVTLARVSVLELVASMIPPEEVLRAPPETVAPATRLTKLFVPEALELSRAYLGESDAADAEDCAAGRFHQVVVGHGAGRQCQCLAADAGIDGSVVLDCSGDLAIAVDGVAAELRERSGQVGGGAGAVQGDGAGA